MADTRLCAFPGCGKHAAPVRRGKAYCFLTETVLTYEGDDCLIWPYAKGRDSYGHIRHLNRDYLVHRLVCEFVNGPPPSPSHEAAHSCGRGHLGCVSKRHLTWKTRTENFADKVRHDTHLRGTRQWNTKLTEADVRRIRALKGSIPISKIAKQFGVRRQTIDAIYGGRSWDWLA